MTDQRVTKFADLLVNHSIQVKKGENIMISATREAEPLILELYKKIIQKGAYPITDIGLPGMSYIYYKNASKEQLKKFPQIKMDEIKKVQGFIGIGSESNTKELANIDPKKLTLRKKITKPISLHINNSKELKRCTTRYPCDSLAQDAEMSLEEYENFVFSAVNQNWNKEKKRIIKINNLFEKGGKVRILGEETDLKMDIRGKNSIADYGEENMPGGEVFMAPVRTSVNGHIKFTYPGRHLGRDVEGIYLEFKNGKVVKYNASKNKKILKEALNTDKNSSYVGELGIGCNPKIKKFTNCLLFDEKIDGTIHLALGMAYRKNGGGNDSAIHWDIVKDLKKGGEIILDGKTIQKNGKWLI